jgi:hypothetical protein
LEDQLFNFFVLTDIPESRVLHVEVLSDLQKTLTEEFRGQREKFIQEKEEIEYKPGYCLDTHELFKISPFDDLDDLFSITSSPISLNSLDPDPELYGQIKAFFAKADNDELLFQHFDRRRIISAEGSLIWSGKTFRKMNEPGLNLSKSLAAVLRCDDLLFSNSWCAGRIFDITQYLKEATDDQINQFLNHANFNSSDSVNRIDQYTNWERTKVSLILESGVLNNFTPEQMKTVATDLRYELLLQDGRIVLPSNKKDLKKLLRFLAEDYMMSPLTEKLHIVTSKRPIS